MSSSAIVQRCAEAVGHPTRYHTIRSTAWVEEPQWRRSFKPVGDAWKSWRRLDGHNQLPELVLDVTLNDGHKDIVKPTDRQSTPPPDRPRRY